MLVAVKQGRWWRPVDIYSIEIACHRFRVLVYNLLKFVDASVVQVDTIGWSPGTQLYLSLVA